MKNSVTIPNWLVGVIVTLALSLGGFASKYYTRLGEQLKINDAMAAVERNDRRQDEVIARHEAILPTFQRDIQEVKQDVKTLLRRGREIQ